MILKHHASNLKYKILNSNFEALMYPDMPYVLNGLTIGRPRWQLKLSKS